MATTRPAPKARTAAVKATLDIATLEREVNDQDRPDPLTLKLKTVNKVITFIDPAELDWQVISILRKENPHSFFEAVIPDPKDLEAFYAEPITAAVMAKIMNGYLTHYEMDNPGE